MEEESQINWQAMHCEITSKEEKPGGKPPTKHYSDTNDQIYGREEVSDDSYSCSQLELASVAKQPCQKL